MMKLPAIITCVLLTALITATGQSAPATPAQNLEKLLWQEKQAMARQGLYSAVVAGDSASLPPTTAEHYFLLGEAYLRKVLADCPGFLSAGQPLSAAALANLDHAGQYLRQAARLAESTRPTISVYLALVEAMRAEHQALAPQAGGGYPPPGPSQDLVGQSHPFPNR